MALQPLTAPPFPSTPLAPLTPPPRGEPYVPMSAELGLLVIRGKEQDRFLEPK